MALLVFYTFAAFGFAYVLGHAVISRPFRDALYSLGQTFPPLRWLVLLLECPACFGFWTGLGVGLWAFDLDGGYRILAAAILACYTAGVNFALGKLLGLMPPEVKD